MTTALRDTPVTPEVVEAHGLRPDEYDRIVELLGRDPNFTELGVFSLMWSEHCGYKYSRALLAELPSDGPQVVQGPGENAGAIDVGDGLAVVFKMESHNHPSAVEPYQGAATGVGGILRDVFTMGARPIATLDSLRFGSLDDPHVRYLFRHVVRGVGDYGNCVGVPTVGGEIVFDDAYAGNPLVNAMCVGLLRHEDLTGASAAGPGNPVYVLGAATGRDGIHGASKLASTELSGDAVESRPTVQIGDPFTEKLLLEATLEIIASGAAVGIQDMGAAGLTSSSSEMAARAGTGIEIDVALVPRREPGMTPYEVLLSESQERMLVVARPDQEAALLAIAAKWDLPCTRVGAVTDDGAWRILEDGEEVCAIPVEALVDEVPRYVREVDPPPYLAEVHDRMPSSETIAAIDPIDALETLLRAPSIASKRWVWEQYDHHVQTNTVFGPGRADAALLRIPGTDRGLALKTDGNGRYVYCDPRRGGALAVAEAARNLTCVGARPLGVTDCLNFGNPVKDAVYHQFVEAVRGITDACRALDAPVVSGNVSFYNESPAGAIYPTPTIGMVGLLEDLAERPRGGGAAGDALVLIGPDGTHLGAGSLLAEVLGVVAGRAPAVDLDAERRHGELVRDLVRTGLARVAHDLSDGGLAVAAAELCFGLPAGLGLDLEIEAGDEPGGIHAALFGEDGARYLLLVPFDHLPAVRERLAADGVPGRVLGRATDDGVLRFRGVGERPRVALERSWATAIETRMETMEDER
ncbi:MAG TPA: phosphoribosylformylglycinamidine synthase subunit PurL [Gemmatimonadota bacterium]|nr:phosphoribosylformylglycinamidine synthase subunit PurL [Gemmatimonadota bacterium]